MIVRLICAILMMPYAMQALHVPAAESMATAHHSHEDKHQYSDHSVLRYLLPCQQVRKDLQQLHHCDLPIDEMLAALLLQNLQVVEAELCELEITGVPAFHISVSVSGFELKLNVPVSHSCVAVLSNKCYSFQVNAAVAAIARHWNCHIIYNTSCLWVL